MKDKCVSCKKETLYNKTDHIDFRLGYVEGAGQLCLDCYDIIYGPADYIKSTDKIINKIKQRGEA
jgi:hypothetical protein